MKSMLLLVSCLLLAGCGMGITSLIPSSDVCPSGIDSVTGQCR